MYIFIDVINSETVSYLKIVQLQTLVIVDSRVRLIFGRFGV